MRTFRVLCIVLCVMFLFILSPQSVLGFYDTFSNHPNNDPKQPDDMWSAVWSGGSIVRYGINQYYVKSGVRLEEPVVDSHYWAAKVSSTGGARTVHLKLYTEDKSSAKDTKNLGSDKYVFEVLISGNTIYEYKNGVFLRQESWNESYRFYPCVHHSSMYWAETRLHFITNEKGLVSGIEHEGYIQRHWETPDASGVYDKNGIQLNKTHFDIEYFWRSFDENCTEIRIKHFTTGTVVKTIPIPDEAVQTWGHNSGRVIVNISDTFYHENPKDDLYGLYWIELMRGSEVVARDYFLYTFDSIDKQKGTIQWDKDSYIGEEVAKVTVTLNSPDFNLYTYKAYIYDTNGRKIDEWTVSSETQVKEIDLSTYESGNYFAILKAREKSSGFEYEIGFDDCAINEEVMIRGVSYDAESGSVLGGVYVSGEQYDTVKSTTTNITTGEYNITGFRVDVPIQINASRTNYIHNNFSFTPLQNGLYDINLFLLPDEAHINLTAPAICGLVQSYPFHQNVSNATVRIWNDEGWNSSTTSSQTGYFKFELDNTSMQTSTIVNETFNSSDYDTWVSLANSGIVPYTEKVTNTTDEIPYVRGVDYEIDYMNGKIKVLSSGNMSDWTDYHIDYEKYEPTTFYLNASAETNFHPSDTYEVNVNATEIKYVYILMEPIFNLTVKARSADTHATIFEFNALLNDEVQKSTKNGSLNFRVDYGIHKIEVYAEGYYSSIEYVYVKENKEYIAYLTPLEGGTEQGVGVSYPPHQVEFACVDMFGNPLANVYVEATPISTTTGSWDWLLNLFGIRNESISYYTNQTLNGTTDSRGAITFVMMENVEYEVRFVNESLGINKTIRIHPKADHYTVILTPVTSSIVSSEDYIAFNLSYEVGDDEITLSLVYNDTLAQTQNLTFFVYNSTSLLYQQNFTNVSNVSVSYTVPYKAGEEYMWGYSAFHSKFGKMGRSRILRIAWFLDFGISRTYCTWIAIAIILFLTGMFSSTTVKFGYVAIPMVSLIFAYIGWLPNISIIIIALCLGILAYMSKREKEVGV